MTATLPIFVRKILLLQTAQITLILLLSTYYKGYISTFFLCRNRTFRFLLVSFDKQDMLL